MGKNKLCIVAGESGGHITPALVLAKRWKRSHQDGTVLFMGNRKALDQKIVSYENFLSATWLTLIKFPGKKFWKFPRFLLQFFAALCKSFLQLRKTRPTKIVSTGGLIALPVCIAGKLLGIPIELYELNIVPGKASRLLKPLAHKTFCAFTDHYPLRFSEQDTFFEREKLLAQLGFSPNKKILFILGGSQGSVSLNTIIKRWIEQNQPDVHIIHQTGDNDKTNWNDFYKKHGISAHAFPYSNEIKDFYLAADLVIGRGGAGTLFELAFFQKRSIIIPLQRHAGGHQVHNALEMQKRHPQLFTVLQQDALENNPGILETHLS